LPAAPALSAGHQGPTGYNQAPAAPTYAPQNNSPFSSPGQALRLRVSLQDFCAHYEISKADEEKLAQLKYKPGNNAVLKLEHSDWKEVGLTALGWQGFLDAHKAFICDVRAGVWDRVWVFFSEALRICGYFESQVKHFIVSLPRNEFF